MHIKKTYTYLKYIFFVCLLAWIGTSSHATQLKKLGSKAVNNTKKGIFYKPGVILPIRQQSCFCSRLHSIPSSKFDSLAFKKNLFPWYFTSSVAFLQGKSYYRQQKTYQFGTFPYLSIGAGIVFGLLYQEKKTQAEGARGYYGYRPYDCCWGKEFKEQAEKALKHAQLLKKAYQDGRFKNSQEENKMIGISVLMELLWAKDQSKHLIWWHNEYLLCCLLRSLSCAHYNRNIQLYRQYHDRLKSEVKIIRDLLEVPQPLGWEEKIPHYLVGGSKAGLIMGSISIIGATPVGAVVVLGTAIGLGAVQVVSLIDSYIHWEKSMKEEEERIQKELYVRALCADEHSIRKAQRHGGYAVSAAMILHGLGSMLDTSSEALGTLEATEAAEATSATSAIGSSIAKKEIKKQLSKGAVRAAKHVGKVVKQSAKSSAKKQLSKGAAQAAKHARKVVKQAAKSSAKKQLDKGAAQAAKDAGKAAARVAGKSARSAIKEGAGSVTTAGKSLLRDLRAWGAKVDPQKRVRLLKRLIWGKNAQKKIQKHIDQIRKRYGAKEEILKPSRGGFERVKEIVQERIAKGNGYGGTYRGDQVIFFQDGKVVYVIRDNGEFWTVLTL